MADSPGKIFAAISKVMGDVGAIGKSGHNRDQNYKFRSIDDVYNKLQPALTANGIFFVPQVIESKEVEGQTRSGTKNLHVRLRVKYTIYAADGSSIESVVEGEGIDTSDKATNKALTAAFKYMLIQIFCIAVEGMDDADKDSPELSIVAEKKPEAPAKKEVKNFAPQAKDMKIPDGKFKGQMLSKIPAAEIRAYIDENLAAMRESGRKAPKWFEDLRKAAGQ